MFKREDSCMNQPLRKQTLKTIDIQKPQEEMISKIKNNGVTESGVQNQTKNIIIKKKKEKENRVLTKEEEPRKMAVRIRDLIERQK